MNESLQYSAEVDIYLECNGERLSVASCLGDKITLKYPIEIAPCSGVLVITVDDVEKRKNVYLPYGAKKDRRQVELEILA